MTPGRQYWFKFASKTTPGVVESIHHRVDVNTFEEIPSDKANLNDISVVDLSLEQQVVADNYATNRATGAFVVIDRITNITVGAGMIDEVLGENEEKQSEFSAFELELNALIRKHFPHWDAKDLRSLVKK